MAKITIQRKLPAGTVNLDQIPAEFVEEFEDMYTALMDLDDPDKHEPRVEFDTEDERDQWMTYAKSYGSQRVTADGSAANLTVVATPKRNLPRTVVYLKITADVVANGNANTHK